jgi:hypothetical protein
VYLSHTAITDCENIIYSLNVKGGCRDIYNSLYVQDTAEVVYYSTGVFKSSHIFYSKCIVDCYQMWFCSNMQGCQECVLCDGLTNQSYCISNKQYTKEDYVEKKAILLADRDTYLARYTQLT